MAATLDCISAGHLSRLHTGCHDSKDLDLVFQVLEILPLTDECSVFSRANRFLLRLSDTHHIVAVELAPELNDLIHSDKLGTGQLLRVCHVEKGSSLPIRVVAIQPLPGRFPQQGTPKALLNQGENDSPLSPECTLKRHQSQLHEKGTALFSGAQSLEKRWLSPDPNRMISAREALKQYDPAEPTPAHTRAIPFSSFLEDPENCPPPSLGGHNHTTKRRSLSTQFREQKRETPLIRRASVSVHGQGSGISDNHIAKVPFLQLSASNRHERKSIGTLPAVTEKRNVLQPVDTRPKAQTRSCASQTTAAWSSARVPCGGLRNEKEKARKLQAVEARVTKLEQKVRMRDDIISRLKEQLSQSEDIVKKLRTENTAFQSRVHTLERFSSRITTSSDLHPTKRGVSGGGTARSEKTTEGRSSVEQPPSHKRLYEGEGTPDEVIPQLSPPKKRRCTTTVANEEWSPCSDGGDDHGSSVKPVEEVEIPTEAKSKSCRQRKTPEQLEILEEAFQEDTNPPKDVREKLAQQTGLPIKSVTSWFSNRRSKARRQEGCDV